MTEFDFNMLSEYLMDEERQGSPILNQHSSNGGKQKEKGLEDDGSDEEDGESTNLLIMLENCQCSVNVMM